MKRYYLCPVALYTDSAGDPYYAAKISQYPGFNYVAEIPNKPDGTPANGWALCHISGKDFSVLDADSEFEFVSSNPFNDGDIEISDKLHRSLKAKGVDLKNKKLKKRELVRAIGKKLSQNFDEEQFRIGD